MIIETYSNVITATATFDCYDTENTDRNTVFSAYPQLERIIYEHYKDIAYNEDKLIATYEYKEYQYKSHISVAITIKLKVLFAENPYHEIVEETLYFQYRRDSKTDKDYDSNIIIETDKCTGDHCIACYDAITGDLLSSITK